MNVVMLSKTPLAAAPYEAAKCLNKYTNIQVRWITVYDRYTDGRIFPKDLLWQEDTVECIKMIKDADVIHIHNEVFPYAADQLQGKRILVQFHSVPMRQQQFNELCSLSPHRYTLSQPLQMNEYSGLPDLPNLIDPEEYTPVERTWDKIRIVFAPTNHWQRNERGSKGAGLVKTILEKFAERCDVQVFSNLSYRDNLERKRHADIVIDDVVGETFHRTSLEAACFGTVVINNLIQHGFMFSSIDSLERDLENLISNTELIAEYKKRSREWIETHHHPKDLCKLYVKEYKKILGS